MNPIRILVVDDETAARRGLRNLLARDDDVVVIGESASGKKARHALKTLKPDVVFLDIQMPDMDGFEVLAALDPEELPTVVFVTAFDEYVLKAFDVHAVDYLLKPFTDERFYEALSRAKQQCRQREAAVFRDKLLALISDRYSDRRNNTSGDPNTAARGEPFLRRLAVGPRDDLSFVDVARIKWIEADAYKVRVHTEGNSFALRGNIGRYEKKLDPEQFFRVSRSAIVNIAQVKGLRTLFRDRVVVVLNDGTELKVARGRRPDLVSLLERTSP